MFWEKIPLYANEYYYFKYKVEMQINTIDITKACVTCQTTMNHKNASVSKV